MQSSAADFAPDQAPGLRKSEGQHPTEAEISANALRRWPSATTLASAREVSLTKQAAQAVSRFALQGNSALLRSDLDGPVKFSFGFVALTD